MKLTKSYYLKFFRICNIISLPLPVTFKLIGVPEIRLLIILIYYPFRIALTNKYNVITNYQNYFIHCYSFRRRYLKFFVFINLQEIPRFWVLTSNMCTPETKDQNKMRK